MFDFELLIAKQREDVGRLRQKLARAEVAYGRAAGPIERATLDQERSVIGLRIEELERSLDLLRRRFEIA